MRFSKPLAGLCIGVLLGACGGGEEPPRGPPQPPTAINITELRLSARTPVATVGYQVEFEGGVCSGGNGPLSYSWTFVDGTPETPPNKHTYRSAGKHTVRVTCRDGSDNEYKFAVTSLTVYVVP